ncbi:CopG family transcriptional regulator [Paenibacillus sp. DS2015]|uniref:CopG family transcriptional regulator n=1 Tax=Paenibacillus sp. DS2015 TaxID=3373917 RepID=UPI003D2513A3
MSESEKITINLGAVDLGKIDLLVEQGFYSNRTDFIRQSIRQQILVHSTEIKQLTTDKYTVIGVAKFDRHELEGFRDGKRMVDIRLIGTLIIAEDVPLELVEETIQSVKVFGIIKARPDIKNFLQLLRDQS